MIVRFRIKFKEWLLIAPVVTVAFTAATFIAATCLGFNDTVGAMLCILALLVAVEGMLAIYSFSVFALIPIFASVLIAVFIPDRPNNVQLICLTCASAIVVLSNIPFAMHLISWQIAMDNEGFTYRNMFGRKQYYKYTDVEKIEFCNFGYKVFVGNKRIRVLSQTRDSYALYEQLTRPNTPQNKLKF